MVIPLLFGATICLIHKGHSSFLIKLLITALKRLDSHYKEDDGDKAARAKLLWDLILTRTKVRHKESRQPRPLRKSLQVYTVPLKVGKAISVLFKSAVRCLFYYLLLLMNFDVM